MIALLTGTVVESNEKSLILDVGGIGYRIAVNTSLRDMAQQGRQLTLRIHHHISDDEESLYGFDTKETLEFFELLLTVPSVGPRTAMGVLEVAPPPILRQAVTEGDMELLTKVSGVGKRTAERIIVELREKITAPSGKGTPGTLQHEVIEALVSIGYNQTQARAAVRKLPKSVQTVQEAVKMALKV